MWAKGRTNSQQQTEAQGVRGVSDLGLGSLVELCISEQWCVIGARRLSFVLTELVPWNL